MSKETLGKMALIRGAIDGRYTVKEVAVRLDLSTRRVKQLKKAYREQGEQAFIHGNSGRHPANYTDEKLREQIINLKKSEIYCETNFTHFRELLEEDKGIQISYGALSNILKSAGIESKRSHRTEGRQFKHRERRAAFGELLQGDASPFDWFGIGERYDLHGFIDDATGAITGLYFCKNECLMGYLEALRHTLQKYGIPVEFYVDKAGIFVVNNKKEENWSIEEMLAGKVLDKTQFGSIADKLGVKIICANTPQAKGRIEKLWNTLQDRLPIWLKRKGIKDMDEANRQIHLFIEEYNQRFAVQPRKIESTFVPLSDSDDLDKLLAVRHERTTDNCGCFSFQNFMFQINSNKPLIKKKIIFTFSHKIGFWALCDKVYYPVTCLGIKKKNIVTHIPDVIKILIEKNYYIDAKQKAA